MKRLSLLLIVLAAVFTLQAAKVDTLTIQTRLLPRPMKVVTVVPDAAAKNKANKFPTVYMLNGYSGSHRDWISKAPLRELSDKYGMILVAPNGMDSWYLDSSVNPKMKMETFFTTELVPYIDRNLPTIKDPSKRAITGLSMGGHGALWLALRHPDIWKNCGSMSGGVCLSGIGGKYKIPEALGKNASAKTLADHSVSELVKTIKPGQNNIIFDCGASDFFAKINDDLHESMLALKIPHDYTSRPGTHSWAYWTNSILYHLLYFNTQFKK